MVWHYTLRPHDTPLIHFNAKTGSQFVCVYCTWMTFTDKNQPLNDCNTQGYPISIILSLLFGMTFGTLKFTSGRKLNSAYLYPNLHFQIRVAGMMQKTDICLNAKSLWSLWAF